MERVRWFEKAPGNTSAMRIIAMLSTVTGCVTVLSGIVGAFLRVPDAAQMLLIGGGMAGLGEVAKAGQALAEKK